MTTAFAANTSAHWFERLDAAEVPCEIADPEFARRLFADPAAQQKKLVATFNHPIMGAMRVGGLYFDLSDTPGTVGRPPLTPGQDSRSILAELGYGREEIDALVNSGAVGEATLERV